MKKMFLILFLLTFSSFIASAMKFPNEMIMVVVKDGAAFSAVFLVLWQLAGAYLKEFSLKKTELSVLILVFIVNFTIYVAGDWSPLLFMAVPVQFMGILFIKATSALLEKLTFTAEINASQGSHEGYEDVEVEIPVSNVA